MRRIYSYKEYLTEEVVLEGPYNEEWLYSQVMKGNKDLHFLVTKMRFIDTSDEVSILERYRSNPDFGVLQVDKKDGEAWIAYRKTPEGISKAERLLAIANSHGGYLSDKTPEEAREIGYLLDYDKKSTEKYINRRYN